MTNSKELTRRDVNKLLTSGTGALLLFNAGLSWLLSSCSPEEVSPSTILESPTAQPVRKTIPEFNDLNAPIEYSVGEFLKDDSGRLPEGWQERHRSEVTTAYETPASLNAVGDPTQSENVEYNLANLPHRNQISERIRLVSPLASINWSEIDELKTQISDKKIVFEEILTQLSPVTLEEFNPAQYVVDSQIGKRASDLWHRIQLLDQTFKAMHIKHSALEEFILDPLNANNPGIAELQAEYNKLGKNIADIEDNNIDPVVAEFSATVGVAHYIVNHNVWPEPESHISDGMSKYNCQMLVAQAIDCYYQKIGFPNNSPLVSQDDVWKMQHKNLPGMEGDNYNSSLNFFRYVENPSVYGGGEVVLSEGEIVTEHDINYLTEICENYFIVALKYYSDGKDYHTYILRTKDDLPGKLLASELWRWNNVTPPRGELYRFVTSEYNSSYLKDSKKPTRLFAFPYSP